MVIFKVDCLSTGRPMSRVETANKQTLSTLPCTWLPQVQTNTVTGKMTVGREASTVTAFTSKGALGNGDGSAGKSLLLLQKTWVQLPAAASGLTTTCNSSSWTLRPSTAIEKLFPLALSEVLLSNLNKDDFTEEGILQIIAELKTQCKTQTT